jgi:mono/diheme cytochrome c family protein
MKPIVAVLATVVPVAMGVFALAFTIERALGDSPHQPSEQERVERGRYIVHRVGMCVDCHSPKDKKGGFIEGKHLTGKVLDFAGTGSNPRMPVAPSIAGLPAGFTMEDTVHFLMTGERPNGRPAPLPPMPQYRMDRRDAESVAAYLRSLSPATP